MSERLRLEVVVRGRVQGVGFRYFVVDLARDLDLDGWVANEMDGSVRCRAEGERPAVDALLEALRVGPPGARVDDLEVRWGPATGGPGGFTVRHGHHRGD